MCWGSILKNLTKARYNYFKSDAHKGSKDQHTLKLVIGVFCIRNKARNNQQKEKKESHQVKVCP